jgi:hypothetical protein
VKNSKCRHFEAAPQFVHFKNFFPQGVGGTVKIVVPQDRGARKRERPEARRPGFVGDRWTIEPQTTSIGGQRNEFH